MAEDTYYIAPPDPSWSKADQDAYTPGKAMLLFTSAHEVWPGHFVQFLHAHALQVHEMQFRTLDLFVFLVGFFVAIVGLASITYRLIEVPGKELLRKRPAAILAEPLVSPGGGAS